MTKTSAEEDLFAHIEDLQEHSQLWHTSVCSKFLTEVQQALLKKRFPASELIKYDGGYPGALKKEVIFLFDEEDDFSDIVCLKAKIDQRFRKITHRDVLGAIMHLQVEPDAFGDLWVDESYVYLYTTMTMADFFVQNLTRINQLNVHFEIIRERPSQQFHFKTIQAVAGSERLDALVASVCHISRAQAKQKIHQGGVSVNHMVLDVPDKVCDNNDTISIRGEGRFIYRGVQHTTKSDRVVAVFDKYM